MTRQTVRYHDRIIQDPRILVGKPVIRGTRIPAELVLAKLAENQDFDELFADYPRLTRNDVKACLEYARDLVERTRRVHPPLNATAEAPIPGE